MASHCIGIISCLGHEAAFREAKLEESYVVEQQVAGPAEEGDVRDTCVHCSMTGVGGSAHGHLA